MFEPNRRALLVGALGLAGAALAPRRGFAQVADFDLEQHYAAVQGEPYPVRAINLDRLDPRFLMQMVNYDTNEAPGTIVIDPARHFLYLTYENGQAIRYGVGVGREGFLWSGVAMIHDKREWPDWYPPKEMLARDPHIMSSMSKLQSGIGMPGGPGNPLGARAMYLYEGNKDTLYRIHGTIEPYTIGTSISSGCIRMINQDAIDLFNRVPVGTKVVVLGHAQPNAQVARQQRVPQYDPNDIQDPVAADPQYDPQAMAPPDPDQ